MRTNPDDPSGTRISRIAIRRGVAVFTAFLLLAGTRALALECPLPQQGGITGTIRETPADIAKASRLLSAGDLENRIDEIVFDLRRRYPEATRGEIVSYLVTAYCPVVNADSGLGDAEKSSKLRVFSSRVYQMVADRPRPGPARP